MAQQVLNVQALVGQNRNQIHGQMSGDLVPQRLYNLAPHRAGGYAPFGRRAAMTRDDGAQVTLAHIANLIGQDETGIASFATSPPEQAGGLELFRGVHVHTQRASNYESPSDAVHLENAGAYMSRDAYLVLDQVNRPVEPINAAITTVPDVGSPVSEHEVGIGDGIRFADIEFGDGVFLAVTDVGVVFRSEDRGSTWEEIADLSGGITSIAYGGGFWVIARNDGLVHRSTDNGDTWAIHTVDSGTTSRNVSWGGGSTFYLGAGNSGAVHRSTDGGATWSVADELSVYHFAREDDKHLAVRVAYHPGSATYVASGDYVNTTNGLLRSFMSVDGTNFDEVDAYTAGSGRTQWVVADNEYFYVLHSTGRLIRSPLIGGHMSDGWGVAATIGGAPAKIKYNSVADTLVVVGGSAAGVSGEPRVWQGGTVSTLARVDEIEDAFWERGTSYVSSVAFDDEGGAVYVGNNGLIVTTDVTPGLKSGTYNVFYVSYFNTKAGRFVFDFRRETHSFNEAFGNKLTIRAQGKGSILANNDWLDGRDDAQEILDSLRFDVYIQHRAEVGDTEEEDLSFAEQAAEYTIRYAFTEPFPDGSGLTDVNRTIDALPLGRQIVANGVPTTAVFEKSRTLDRDGNRTPIQSRTALHNGRVWGLAAQDEERWHDEDEISPEIANQFNRFVLTYTETGWANLISDQSYIPIQPTQSQFFTGMLSTPSGLMLMFENEIFLVDGDPAFGNLSVQLYLDMAGCDVGAMPCKIGGLPFTVWDGKIWLLQAGQAQEISGEQWLPDDPFIRIAPEPQTRSLVALTEKGRVLRYLVDQSFWLTDTVTRDDAEIAEMFPNCTCITGHNTRFADDSGRLWATVLDGTPDTPHIVYRDVDFGAPERRTPLYIAKLTLEGPLVGAQYDRDEPDYDPEQIPALFYEAGSSSNGNTHETVAEQPGGIRPYCGDPGARRVNTLSFRPPLRVTRSYTLNLRFELRGMSYDDVVRPPVRLHHAVGGETR